MKYQNPGVVQYRTILELLTFVQIFEFYLVTQSLFQPVWRRADFCQGRNGALLLPRDAGAADELPVRLGAAVHPAGAGPALRHGGPPGGAHVRPLRLARPGAPHCRRRDDGLAPRERLRL